MFPYPQPLTETPKKGSHRRPFDTGATEDQMDMAGTLPQHSNKAGTKIEDEAGTGEVDSGGG
jgi:hypothetical protein